MQLVQHTPCSHPQPVSLQAPCRPYPHILLQPSSTHLLLHALCCATPHISCAWTQLVEEVEAVSSEDDDPTPQLVDVDGMKAQRRMRMATKGKTRARMSVDPKLKEVDEDDEKLPDMPVVRERPLLPSDQVSPHIGLWFVRMVVEGC